MSRQVKIRKTRASVQSFSLDCSDPKALCLVSTAGEHVLLTLFNDHYALYPEHAEALVKALQVALDEVKG